MNTILIPVLQVISVALDLYKWAVIIWVVLSWLVQFNIINSHNQFVRTVGRALDQVVDPALRRIRRVVPMMGNLDISPIILFLIILLIQLVIGRVIIDLAT
jgi:YggT family protein